jgi:hypothetical protein
MSAFEGKHVIDKPFVASSRPSGVTLRRIVSSPVLSVALIVAAIVQQIVGHIDCDVSWLITFAEKYLDGQVPYVDATDPNPPASFLSLVPAVLIARILRTPVEPVVAALVFVAAGVSIHLTGHALHRGRTRSLEEWGALRNGAIFLFLIAPEIAFAEREHLALLAMIPMLAVMAVGAQGASMSLALRLIAGAGAGLAICFKPYFALAIVFPALAIAWRERSVRSLFQIEMWTILAVVALYGAVIPIFFPSYPSALPLIVDVYAPARDSWADLALHTFLPLHLALLAGFVVAAFVARGAPPLSGVAAWASAGFLASFLIQGKGWINHAYPGVALILFAWIAFALERRTRTHRISDRLVKFLFVPALVAAPALHGGVVQWSNEEEHPGLRAAVARVAPAHPRLIAIARQMDIGHPLTRQLDGTWVGRASALWVSSNVGRFLPTASDPAYRARLLAYRHQDLLALAEDVARGRPDIIIVEDPVLRQWVLEQLETTGVLNLYAHVAAAGVVEIWTRKRD